MPQRLLYAEPLRRRMRAELGGRTVVQSDDAVVLFEPGRCEEDDRILGHAADPYHRIDIRHTSRHLVVRSGDRIVADTTSPLVLYESGFASCWYVPETTSWPRH